MTISMIWAMSRDGLIGKNNGLPWRLPRDMAFFKEQTLQKTIVMGRKTWESFGSNPLPNRKNIVLTRDSEYRADGADVAHTVAEIQQLDHNEEIMIIGGAEIYKLFWPLADRLMVTEIDAAFAGDTYFPKLDWSPWRIVEEFQGIKDDKNPYDYRFLTYERR
ncbi:dihydrofolate reductase [Paenibacillus sp. JX-17]|uniref:Dihydrofolate reductase n=1 Tax=Paenibacillus lacisoli TaxID=3064525 RepID=A0ABT9C888_9BACL|nr:dihydrofolate reductase [Paenibacillus sp. JX-17]MDO7904899.1 dihydrofolate reductase [Paenibacillus sp. JX-17]